jgi:hypothetical protein
MTVIDCPRCHGLKFNNETKQFDKGHPNPTMRVDNVMATTQMIHYACGNCGYKEQQPYGQDGEEKRPEPPKAVEKQQTLF